MIIVTYPKYKKGNKVRIIEVKNQDGELKYPNIQKHINKTGTVLSSLLMPIKGLKNTSLEDEILDVHMYKIQLDNTTILENIMEDSLVASSS
jgi:hypothetical protein